MKSDMFDFLQLATITIELLTHRIHFLLYSLRVGVLNGNTVYSDYSILIWSFTSPSFLVSFQTSNCSCIFMEFSDASFPFP